MHAFRHFLPYGFTVNPKHSILAGGAAGISAAFNTPLAGIVFAIEELGRRFEQKTNGVIVTAIVLSGLVAITFLASMVSKIFSKPLYATLVEQQVAWFKRPNFRRLK
jgi:H+/Cl- antiporter ClcA